MIELPRQNVPPLPTRLRRLSLIVRGLILFGAGGLVASTVWTWSIPAHALAQVKEVSSVCIDHLGPQAQAVGALWTLLPVGVLLLGLQRLWVLFGEFARGQVFSQRAFACLRGFARCLLAMAVVSPTYAAVLSVIATWQNAPGHRQLNISVSSDHFAMLLLGAVLLAISSVMAEAARVAEDNAGFV